MKYKAYAIIIVFAAPRESGIKSFYCDHCQIYVGKSTFYEHRALYGLKEVSNDGFGREGDSMLPVVEAVQEYLSESSSGESELFEEEYLDFFSGDEEKSDDDSIIEQVTNEDIDEESFEVSILK